MLSVSEFMTAELHTLGPDSSMMDARDLMSEYNIHHIPVIGAGGELIGIVSQKDVLAAGLSTVRESDDGDMAQDIAISTIMSSPVETVQSSSNIRATAVHLQMSHLGCLPVVDGGLLVGIITDSDFVTIAIDLMEQLELAESSEVEEDMDQKLDEAMGLGIDFDDLLS